MSRESIIEKIAGPQVSFTNVQEMAKQKGLDWTASKWQVPNMATGKMSDHYQIIRDDNHFLLNNNVSAGYQITQPIDIFDFTNAFAPEGAVLTNCGQLDGGKKIFVQAQVSEFDLKASGDITKNYFSGVSSFDGSAAESYKESNIRIVCKNTFMAVVRAMAAFKFYHTKGLAERRKQALKLLAVMRETARVVEEKMEILTERQVKGDLLQEILFDLYEIKGAKDVTPQKAERIATTVELFERNDDNAFPQWRGTAYNAFNAITEEVDHFAGKDYEKAAVSAMFGQGEAFKTKALEVIIEKVGSDGGVINTAKAYSFGDGRIVEADNLLDDIISDL